MSATPQETRSTCPYCGVGCGVIIETQAGAITGVRGDPEHPANFGRLCTKGSTLHLTASAAVTRQTRLLQPLQRLQRRGPTQPLAWDTALDLVADRLSGIVQAHGPDALGFYLSGQLLTEDYYVFNKLAKGLLGTNNLDTNSRLCMSSAVAGYKATLGADAPPASYADFDHADCLFIAGSNAAWAHPIAFRRIEDAKRARPGMKIVVVDPRRTDTVELADLHLAIQPGTDVMLFHGMLHIMLREGWTKPAYIAAHTSGFEALQAVVRDVTPEHAAQVCGISVQDLHEAARLFATSSATLSLYCQGLNQSSSGTAKNAALINLHLATGQIGRPGAAPFSLTGQPNAMGGREVGGLSNLLSAHRDMANAEHRAEVAAHWGVAQVPGTPGKSAVEMFEAAADGQIKALWIACTNPAQSMPDQATVRRALQRAEFVVLQEAFVSTATAEFADLLLPATTWGEKMGTVTNSERRISRVRPAAGPSGEARHDWFIFTDFGRRLEARLPDRTARYRAGTRTLFPYTSPESVWNEHRESTRGRDLDITGLSYALLDSAGPQQWPMPQGAAQGTARLYTDGVFPTANGRARFAAMPYEPVAEAQDAAYPFSLNTGRLRDQWHGMSRTGTLGRLFGHVSEPVVEVNPQDLARLGLQDGALVSVRSRRGELIVPAQANDGMAEGQAYIAMHWGAEYLGGADADGLPRQGVNALTQPRFCPTSKQPELKHAAVRIEPATLPWRLTALAWLPADQALAVREALKPVMAAFPFASCVPFGREGDETGPGSRVGVLFRAAAAAAADEALLARLLALMGLAGDDVMRYTDWHAGQHRAMRLARDGEHMRLQACLLAGDDAAAAWLRPLLQDDLPVESHGRLLLAPGATPPAGLASRGKQVCTCFNVSETDIEATLPHCAGTDDARLAVLQGELKCGTNCGSCIPALRKLIKLHPALEAAA